jgi:2-keto-4-pentenoate hydratase/2-oxohepta-3-ene-1,7-dioic acid hydratase in catechol pathway
MKLTREHHRVVIQTPGGPLTIPMILAIGKNYADHAKEQGAAVPTRPVVFAKNISALALNDEAIVIPKVCQDREQVDFEGELGIVVGSYNGRACKDVSLAEALYFVMGYCACNDVSARWWQKEGGGGQFVRGKSFDTFCPISPITPAHDVPDTGNLRIVTRVNGQVMQDASTREMIFNVATLIHELSKGTTLLPGTLILTGTPAGVGMSRTPPVWLKAGDQVEVEIEKVGKVSNRVRSE